MKNIFTLLILSIFLSSLNGQHNYSTASLNEDGTYTITPIDSDYYTSKTFDSDLEPFMVFSEEAFFVKNTRGVALAHLDGDGVEEIIFGIDKTLYAIDGTGTVLFQKELTGPVLIPPAIADLTGDGNPEVVVNYGYPSTTGGITVLDNEFNELSGWPVSFDGNWMINAPALADLDGDGIMEIITGERVSASVGHVHALKIDGTPFNENWPVTIESTPAFTPSVGDINNDGVMDIVIAGSSTGMYVFDSNGNLHPGFPIQTAGVGYSYQSPILVDLTGDDNLEIVGSNHGDNPGMYVMKHDGSYLDGWPRALPSWTYSPATVADIDDDGTYEIFMGFPNMSENPEPVIYGMQPDGSDLDNFPIEKVGGNEGVITIADINDDGIPDLIFSSNTFDNDGDGFLHAFSSDGSGELDGFPLRPRGWTFMNGAVIGDVDNDGMMDLTVLSYTNNFGADIDSIFVSSYNLNVAYDPDKILSNGYKGNNTRNGLISKEAMSVKDVVSTKIQVYPNPSSGELNITMDREVKNFTVSVFDLTGRKILFDEKNKVSKAVRYEFGHLPKGTYLIYITADGQSEAIKWVRQ